MNTDLRDILFQNLGFAPEACAGKVIVITGSGRGIGLAAARAFAMLGGRVVIAELTEQGQQAEAAICAEGGQAQFIQTDVADPASVQRLADTVHQTYGSVDILVNNAIRCPAALVGEMSLEVWDEVIAVNLRGTFLTCRAFLPDLLARGSGVIINMVSTDAMPGLSAYIASKQGIVGFSQSLALEVGSAGVQVIPFAPGMVDTPGIRAVSGRLSQQLGLTQEQFLQLSLHAAYDGLMPPEHAGAATAYLALQLATEFHGQVVNGYEVLERAGLLLPADIQAGPPASVPASPGQPAVVTRKAIEPMVDQVCAILTETGREFEKLPVFVRPLARSGFKSKAGASLDDWQRALQAFKKQPTPSSPALAARLEKLIGYYRGVPGETARFTRDQDLLAEITQTCNRRIAALQQLIDAIR